MIVFDSSTLVLLAKTELLDLLLNDYRGSVVVTSSVAEESIRKGTFDGLLIRKRIEEGKIKVQAARSEYSEKIMADFNINKGEAETIVAALANKGSVVATDDKSAIRACKLLNVLFTTAIDVLITAKRKNLLTKEEAILKLEELSRQGRYKARIIEDAKKKLKGDD